MFVYLLVGWVGILWLLGFVVVGWLGWVLVCFLSCPHQDKPVITKLILKLLCPSTGFVEEEEASGDARECCMMSISLAFIHES